MKIAETVAALARPVVESKGLVLWDVEFVKEAGGRYLRVYIDKKGEPVAISDCEAVSKELDAILDEADPIPESYTFEVSSAGAERALKRASDFDAFIGSRVAVHLYSAKDGRKVHLGTLLSYQDGDVEIDVGGAQKTFNKSEVSLVRLSIS